MTIKLVAYGIARDILETSSMSFELGVDPTISALKEKLLNRYPAFTQLSSLRFAVNEDYQNDQFELKPNDEVVIIPPVSGG